LAEIVASKMKDAMPEANYVAGSGTDLGKIGLGTDSGFSLYAYAKELRLHPRRNAGTNKDEDIYIWKAVPVENIALNYKVDEQTVLEVTFRALYDDTKISGHRLGQIGDSTVS
jgi:hypothetical protein